MGDGGSEIIVKPVSYGYHYGYYVFCLASVGIK